MAFPTMVDYNDSIQNPQFAFKDTFLKSSTIAVTPLGMPKVVSGGFALTYKLSKGNQHYAVRCFHKEVPDLQQRYEKISSFIKSTQCNFFVEFDYQREGIRVNNSYYPIMKMNWVDGQLLNTYVENNLTNSSILDELINQIIHCSVTLQNLKVSHGDLQHGNIMIVNNQVKLIDYDGMYVPNMSISRNNELGHVNYQHPLRNEQCIGSDVDRFSSIVIYLALKALRQSPHLWNKYDNGENLLFRIDDFLNPSQSELISDLKRTKGIEREIENFINICRNSFDNIPTLSNFISGNIQVDVAKQSDIFQTKIIRRQYDVFNSEDTINILKNLGNVVEVVGQVTNVKLTYAKNRQPCAFINFGDYKKNCFRIVLWSEALRELKRKGIDLESYNGKWISVIQLVDQYKGAPQFVLDASTKINVFKNYSEAKTILSGVQQVVPRSGYVERKTNKDILNSIQDIQHTEQTNILPHANNNNVPVQNKTKNQIILEEISSLGSPQAQTNKNVSKTTSNLSSNSSIPTIPTKPTLTRPSLTTIPNHDDPIIIRVIKKVFKFFS